VVFVPTDNETHNIDILNAPGSENGAAKTKGIYLARETFYGIWAAGSSETTWRHIPQDCKYDTHRGMNLVSLM
jgi:hypothetical protein